MKLTIYSGRIGCPESYYCRSCYRCGRYSLAVVRARWLWETAGRYSDRARELHHVRPDYYGPALQHCVFADPLADQSLEGHGCTLPQKPAIVAQSCRIDRPNLSDSISEAEHLTNLADSLSGTDYSTARRNTSLDGQPSCHRCRDTEQEYSVPSQSRWRPTPTMPSIGQTFLRYMIAPLSASLTKSFREN